VVVGGRARTISWLTRTASRGHHGCLRCGGLETGLAALLDHRTTRPSSITRDAPDGGDHPVTEPRPEV